MAPNNFRSIDIAKNKLLDFLSVKYGVTIQQIYSPSRKREVVVSRQIIMYVLKYNTEMSLETIGSEVDDRDHATVLHALKTINNLRDTDKAFKSFVKECEVLFNEEYTSLLQEPEYYI